MIISKIISTAISSGKRLIKSLGYGAADVQESTEISPWGIDSVPVKDTPAARSNTGTMGVTVILGYVQGNRKANEGETRFYSTDSSGNEVAYMYLTDSGELELNGNADNAVRFSELKKVVDEIQGDIRTLKQVFTTWVPAPTDGGAALKAAAGTWFATPLTENIDSSKVDTVKLP